MNQIARSFIFVALVVAILLALHFLPKLSIGETELRRVNVLSDVLPEYMDDGDGLGFIPDVPEPPKPITVVTPVAPADSQHAAARPVVSDGVRLQPTDTTGLGAVAQTPATDSVVMVSPVAEHPEGVTPILDYSQGRAGGMYYFYQQLARARQLGRPVRIAYYGDSFIEGDIFTQDLRELMQDQFGGSGVGWVDCASKVHGFRQSVVHSFSGITEYEIVKRPFSNANQGIAQRYFTATEGARITYKGARARRHQSQWTKAIFYLRSDGGCRLYTTMNGSDSILVDTIAGAARLQTIECRDTVPMSSVSYTLRGMGSGTLFYGVALEPVTGVVVDNFSMRGSAGSNLSQIPEATLAQFAALRPYDLIVVHYGLNVANTGQSNYSGYARNMGQAIDHLRRAYPQTSILVVGMPDRDQRASNGLHTMKGVEALVAYQQIMASDHAVSFFNLFEAMGGRDSMKGLVEQGFANKDYTHINFKGGRHLARFLFDAIMAGYHSYGF
jgi:lysophospholipase L1-like esterase